MKTITKILVYSNPIGWIVLGSMYLGGRVYLVTETCRKNHKKTAQMLKNEVQ